MLTNHQMLEIKKAVENVIEIKDVAAKIYYATHEEGRDKKEIIDYLKNELDIDNPSLLYLPSLQDELLQKVDSLEKFVNLSETYLNMILYKDKLIRGEIERFTCIFYNEIPLFQAEPWAKLLEELVLKYTDGDYQITIYDLGDQVAINFETLEEAQRFANLIKIPGTIFFLERQDDGADELIEMDCF